MRKPNKIQWIAIACLTISNAYAATKGACPKLNINSETSALSVVHHGGQNTKLWIVHIAKDHQFCELQAWQKSPSWRYGQLPKGAIAEFIALINTTDLGIVADDAQYVKFLWDTAESARRQLICHERGRELACAKTIARIRQALNLALP